MTLPLKSSAVCALIASTLLLGACSTSEEDAGVWSVQDVYSGNSVSKPQVAQAGNGDLIVIWQEFERGDIQADTAKNAAHDPQKTDPALILANSEHGAHDHYFQCQRTNIWVRRYDAATDTWEAATQLQTGKWRKTTTYLADDSLTPPLTADQYELDENVAKPLDSGATLALDGSGNALAVWNQNLVDDCNAIPTVATAPVLYAVRYDITSRSWASPATVQNNSNNIADAKNLQIKLNSAGAGLIAWEQVLNDSQNVGAQNLPAVYAAGYNGTTVGTPTLINDSITSGGYTLLAAASQPALDVNSNGDGVIAWRHVPRKANITDEPVSEIRVKRFTATGSSWGTSLTLGSGTARTANYTPSSSVESPAVTLDDSDRIWTIWIDDSRTDTNSGTITNRLAKTMVNDVSDADVIGTAQALQTDDANTATVNEAQLNQLEPRIVSVANGRVVASWIQRHRYSNVDGLINDWNNNVTDTLRLATFANATWSDAFSVAQSRLDAFSPRLAKLSSDSVALAWTQLNDPRTGSHNALKFVRYSFATGISNIETLGEIKDPYSFALSANGQNNASLTWSNDTQITAAVLK